LSRAELMPVHLCATISRGGAEVRGGAENGSRGRDGWGGV